MEKILTICTAAYNVKNSISRMIDSVINSKNASKVELIIINDGSKDDTERIVSEYLNKYSDIIKYKKIVNSGSGGARNIGIEMASGKYFRLLDGDDYYDTEALDDFILFIEKYDVDMVISDFTSLCDEKPMNKVSFINILEKGKIYKLDEDVLNTKMMMHSTTFATRILKDSKIKLSTKTPYVDAEFLLLSIPYVNTYTYCDANVYMYVVGIDGQSMTIESRLKNEKKYQKVIERLIDDFCLRMNNNSLNKGQIVLISNMLKIYSKNIYKHNMWHNDKRKKELIEIDIELLKKDKYIEHISEENRIIKIMRKTNYSLYSFIRCVVRLEHKIYALKAKR